MTYDTYRYIFFGGAGLAALSLVIAVLLFFLLRIPRVIGDLSGVTARKAIDEIRKQNELSGNKLHKSSEVNLERGKVTDKIVAPGTPAQTVKEEPLLGAMATEKIGTRQLAEEAQQAYESSLRKEAGANETTLLNAEDSGATTLLNTADSGETTVLNTTDSGETTVLEQNKKQTNINSDASFVIEYDITLIHTDEVIA